jgi:hypothetical protein
MAEEDEDRHVGTVTWHVYWEFFNAALPSVLIFCFAFFYLAVQGKYYSSITQILLTLYSIISKRFSFVC